MRRWMALIGALVALSGAVSAQTATHTPSPTTTPTATPTTDPNALSEGNYELESLTAPRLALTGTWVINVGSSYTYLRTSAVGSSAAMTVMGRWIVIWRRMINRDDRMSVCVNGGSCRTVNNNGGSDSAPVAVDLGAYGQHRITITFTSGVDILLDQIWVLQGNVLPGAIGTPQPAPSPYVMVVPAIATANPGTNSIDDPVVWATLPPATGTPSGQMTRFEYAATAGDVHIANLLTMILLSMWAMFLIWLIAIWRRK